MADSRFFQRQGPFTLAEIAERAGATLADGVDGAFEVSDVAPLDTAGGSELSFLDNRKYLAAFSDSLAAACIVAPDIADQAPMGMRVLISKDPYRSYAKAAALFYPRSNRTTGVHPAAHVDGTASLGEGVTIGPGAVIEAGVELADGVEIGANTVIMQGVVIAEGSRVEANCTIQHALIGRGSTIFPGTRIGQDGFGFAMGPEGHLKVPQLGRVVIGDDVEIGANCTIDRGAGPDTVIGDGTRIDNLVQIGHNVRIGRGCVLVSMVGVSGSTEFGDFVIAAGQAGFGGHLKIGSGAQIAAQAGVTRDIAPMEKVGGTPAVPLGQYHRQAVKLAALVKGKAKERR